MPSLFKERLFVYLSRFCEVRYCIARHVGFLVGLGRPAGDAACLPQDVEDVLPLLRRPLARGDDFSSMIEACGALGKPMTTFPAPDSTGERALFACATHVFLQTPDAPRAHDALRDTLTPSTLEHLNVFLAFIRTAHYWTRLHPELSFEGDIADLLAANEALSECILNDPEAAPDALSRRVAADLASLQELRDQNAAVVKAYEALSLDHQFVEQSLRDREANLRELVSVVPAAVYSCDAEGRMIYYNRHAVELWGREPSIGDTPRSFLDERLLLERESVMSPAAAPVRQVLATGKPVINKELTLERPDGSRIDTLVNIAPLRDSSGRITGAVNIFQDISDLKGAQRERDALMRELERSNNELSNFSYAVSHDLQGPIRSVRTLTAVLVRRNGDLKDDVSHLGELIEQAARGMESLIDSLLRYAQVGQGELKRQNVSIEALMNQVKVSLSALVSSAGASIFCSGLPVVSADPAQLAQVFQNLLANAIKYHRAGVAPEIEIQAERFGDEWRFSVKDNGEGIEPRYHDLVFQPLKRLHGSDEPGSGLGLALCKTIISRHGGRIWIESDGLGRGTTFWFTLPAATRQSQPEETARSIQSS